MNKLRLILLGAPGAGKGTYAKQLGPHFGIPVVSTGDLIRSEITSGSALGKEIKDRNDKGQLINDQIVTNIAKQALQSITKTGFILDGFPRTVPQAESLESFSHVDLVVSLSLPDKVLIQKIVSRLTCPQCGEGYNTANIHTGDIEMPALLPKREGVCDKCGTCLSRRADDNIETVKNRLEVYKEETFPLIQFYESKGLMQRFDIKKGLGDLPRLVQLCERYIPS